MRICCNLILAFILISPVTLFALQVTGLSCNDEYRPIAIDDVHPRLRWQISSSPAGASQSGYRLLVSCSPQALAGNVGDIWGSGKKITDQCYDIPLKIRYLNISCLIL